MGASLALALVLAGFAGCAGAQAPPGAARYPEPVPLRAAGLIGGPSGPVFPVSPREAIGASYLPLSDVLRLPDGRLRYAPPGAAVPETVLPDDPGARAAVAETRAWLAEGTIPSASGAERDLAARALLNLRLLARENGAVLAGAPSRWAYVWPRDASFAAAAFAATGHHEESGEVLRFLAKVQGPDGSWEARYASDGAPVLDGRPPQADATGWFPWALWLHHATLEREDPRAAGEDLRGLWPAAHAAADAAADSLGPDGLPPGGADYWETRTWRPNLGTAAPLRTGLRAAADLARDLGHEADARRYAAAAIKLDEAIGREFAPTGYGRTVRPGSGADAAVNFLAPPFAPPDPSVEAALDAAARRLRAPNGGFLPGEAWPQDPTVAWTPETALFALSAAAGGDGETAARRLGWLAAHATALGAYPEKVDGGGSPKSAAPLAWTEALVLLALAEGEEPLPVPPVPGRPVPDDGSTPPPR